MLASHYCTTAVARLRESGVGEEGLREERNRVAFEGWLMRKKEEREVRYLA